MQKAIPYLVIFIVVVVGGHLWIDYQKKKQPNGYDTPYKAPGPDHAVTEAEQRILDALSKSGCEIEARRVLDEPEPSLYIISWTIQIKNMPDVITPDLSIKNGRGTYTFGWSPAFDTYEKLKRIQSLREESR